MKLVILTLTLLVSICPAFAQNSSNPREQLKQYVAELQRSPGDQALREKIIKLALALDPKPGIPEEAERHMARGAAAIKEAKTEQDFKDAVLEFQQATLTVPWLANAYYNLGVAQSRVGDYGSAAKSLKLYLLAAPDAADAKEAKNLMYEMEYKQEKVDKELALKAEEQRRQTRAAEAARATEIQRREYENQRIAVKRRAYEKFVGHWTSINSKGREQRDALILYVNDNGDLVMDAGHQAIGLHDIHVDGSRIVLNWAGNPLIAANILTLDINSDGTKMTGSWWFADETKTFVITFVKQ